MAKNYVKQVLEAKKDLIKSGVGSISGAIVLGSGWKDAVQVFGKPKLEVPYEKISGFSKPSVAGHAGSVLFYDVGQKVVMVYLGRTHLYEGLGVDKVVLPVRLAKELGAEYIVLTNGCGSISDQRSVGDVVLLKDHINLTGMSPLSGPNFVDMSFAYSPRLRSIAHFVSSNLSEGVYAQMLGPQYETPAEIKMLENMGADLVGMSTAVETIAAKEVGLEVLGMSLITNLAAGVGEQELSHQEVLEAGSEYSQKLGELLFDIVKTL